MSLQKYMIQEAMNRACESFRHGDKRLAYLLVHLVDCYTEEKTESTKKLIEELKFLSQQEKNA